MIAKPQYPLGVRDHDHLNVRLHAVRQNLVDVVLVRKRNKEPTRTPVDVAKAFACFTDGRRVDDRQHLVDVVDGKPIEKRFVRILQIAQVDVLFQIRGVLSEGLIATTQLLRNGFDLWRQQAKQTEFHAFFGGERGPLVQ
ncbi:MAG: hypothetical protein R3C10_26685 [Pirellulales bacterium]